jgi:hypothetical protein
VLGIQEKGKSIIFAKWKKIEQEKKKQKKNKAKWKCYFNWKKNNQQKPKGLIVFLDQTEKLQTKNKSKFWKTTGDFENNYLPIL